MYKKTITPAEAREIIDRSGEQRAVRPGHVKRLAAIMARSEWGESVISFDEHDRLVDGQHRLRALIMVDAPVSFYVRVMPRQELLALLETEARTSAADKRSKLLGRTVSAHQSAIMDHCGCSYERAVELAPLVRRVTGGGVSLAHALVSADLADGDEERFVEDIVNGTQPAAAVLGRWLSKHAVRPSVAARAGIEEACKLAISRWQRRQPVTEAALTRSQRGVSDGK